MRALLLSLAVALAGAQEVLVDPDEAATQALSRVSEVTAARQDERAALLGIDATWAFTQPQIGARLGADRRYPLDERSQAGFVGSIGVDQHLYTPGRWGAITLTAAARREAAAADLATARRDVALRARLAVERVRLAKARLEVLTERLQQRRNEQADAEALFSAGRLTVTEVRQAGVAVAQAEDAVLGGEGDLAATRRELAAALELDPPVDARGMLRRPGVLPDLLAVARAGRSPEARALEARRRTELGSAAQREAAGMPGLFVSADTSSSGPRYDRTFANWGVSASVRWSLYDGGARTADIEAAAAREAALAARLQVIERERRRTLDTIGDEIAILAGRLELAERTLTAAQENYDDALERFRAGRLRRTDVDAAGLAVLESRLSQAQLIAREAEIAHRLRALAE